MTADRQRWVIKIGSALLTNDGKGLDVALMQSWVDRMVMLRQRGIEVVIVSSGAVAEGMTRLGWARRPVVRLSCPMRSLTSERTCCNPRAPVTAFSG